MVLFVTTLYHSDMLSFPNKSFRVSKPQNLSKMKTKNKALFPLGVATKLSETLDTVSRDYEGSRFRITFSWRSDLFGKPVGLGHLTVHNVIHRMGFVF